MTLANLQSKLRATFNNPNDSELKILASEIKLVLDQALAADDLDAANKSWYLYTLTARLVDYLAAYSDIKTEAYYKAWCALERIEISVANLKRNRFIEELREHADALGVLIAAWQALYPYHIFFSPEIIIKREKCSVCGLDVSPWDDCGHRRGYVYSGVPCHYNVVDMEFRGVSLVSDPVQKFSVPFTSDENGEKVDQYDYSPVKFVADRL